jgi:hypothetical protein
MVQSAYHEAVTSFEQALAALAHLPERRDTIEQAIDLRCDLRNVLLPLNEHFTTIHFFTAKWLHGILQE